MNEKSKVVDRGALYYPFIHVRDESWLKATLLCFPYLDRMVPDSYAVNDGAVARFFAAQKGRLGRTMLGRRDLGDPATEHARSELLEKLREDLGPLGLATRFSREAAKHGPFKDGENAFQIHEYKLGGGEGEFLGFLLGHGLAWQPTMPVRGGARWWAVHPELGEAIMSTNAVALARAHDLEIVTSDEPTHQALLGTTASEVYDVLVRRRIFGKPRPDATKANDLMRFVIVSAFDLDGIPLEKIVELSQQRRDISALKTALLSEVEDVGAMPDWEVWNDVLAVRSREVVDEWESRASFLAMFTRVDAKELAGEFQDFLKKVAPAVATGVAATAFVGALPGLAVGVVFGAVHLTSKWHESQRPYRFLSSLVGSGAQHRHRLDASPA